MLGTGPPTTLSSVINVYCWVHLLFYLNILSTFIRYYAPVPGLNSLECVACVPAHFIRLVNILLTSLGDVLGVYY